MSDQTAQPEPPTAPEKPRLLVFVHIQKTAGKTLRQIFYRQYTRGHTRLVRNYFVAPEVSRRVVEGLAADPPKDLRVIHGHILFWPDIEWPEGTQFLAMLRDPVERAISHYYWLRARSSRFRKSFEEALTSGSVPDNLQTRVLSAQMPPFGETTDKMLDDALRSLDRLDVVGLTARFDESFVLATRVLGWRRMLYRKENVTPDRKPTDEISAKVVELIRKYNALDIELYRSASKQFERQVEAQGEGFAIEVAALQRANERVAGLPEDAPLPPLTSSITGPNGAVEGELGLRELVVEAQAELLQRDAAVEYLSTVSTPRGAKAVATRARKRESPTDQRKVALDAAIERAASRLADVRKEIRALEKEGMAGSQAELDALRKTEETTAKRLAGFQRRSGKLANRLQSNGNGDGPPEASQKPVAASVPGRSQEASERSNEAPERSKKAKRAAREAGRAGKRNREPKAAGDGQPEATQEPGAAGATPERPKKKAKRPRETADATGARRTTKAEGTRRFESAPPELVWDILDQPDRIAQLIPAVESIDIKDESHWTAKVKVPLKRGAPLLLECEKSEERRPEHGRLRVRGKGGGTVVTIDGTFDLSESNGGTEMKWQTDVDLTGVVGPMRPRVLQLLVRTQMKNLLGALEREVARTGSGS